MEKILAYWDMFGGLYCPKCQYMTDGCYYTVTEEWEDNFSPSYDKVKGRCCDNCGRQIIDGMIPPMPLKGL
jgi:hypothetical protein